MRKDLTAEGRGGGILQDTRIALVQMQAGVGQIEKNLLKIENFVKEAAGKKANMICFPEMSISGYSRKAGSELAQKLEERSVASFLLQLARDHKMVIIAGLAEKNAKEKPYITQVIAEPEGILQKYRKTHLGISEQPYFTQGEEIQAFSTPGAKIGIQICWETHFPEMTTILSLQGAEIIFSPHASPTMVGDRRAIWLKYLPARAYDNAVFMAACNLVGEGGRGRHFCGGALVIDPKGNVLAEDFAGKESLLVVDLKADQINRIRKQKRSTMANSFYLQCRRPELYKELITKS